MPDLKPGQMCGWHNRKLYVIMCVNVRRPVTRDNGETPDGDGLRGQAESARKGIDNA